MNPTLRPLSEDQIIEFYREGYIVAKQLVPHDVIDSIVEGARKMPANADGSWTAKCFDFAKPLDDTTLHQCLVEEHVVAAVEQLFETRARAYYGMLAVVKAKGGKGLPWHQDNQYDQVMGRALNSFVALCDITPDKGILWVAPRTHLLGTQPSKAAPHGHREAEVEPEGGMPLPGLKKGDVCIFDRNTYHRSLKNDTNDDRYAYAAQYVEENARYVRLGGSKDLSKFPVRELQAMLEGALA
jgi:ectoine hydroxylase-related dioxygenase (phytanoyl-CoA dioxygenase family)